MVRFVKKTFPLAFIRRMEDRQEDFAEQSRVKSNPGEKMKKIIKMILEWIKKEKVSLIMGGIVALIALCYKIRKTE